MTSTFPPKQRIAGAVAAAVKKNEKGYAEAKSDGKDLYEVIGAGQLDQRIELSYATRERWMRKYGQGKGKVEVISSLEADGRKIPYDIRMGVWVTVEAETEYIKNCFEEYNAHTDPSGRYFTLYKRWHLIGLEVGMSVASVALRGEPTGVAQGWNADVVATAKRDLKGGELLDGEGGYTVWGKLLPAAKSLAIRGLPLGLAHQIKLKRAVPMGQCLSWDDVEIDPNLEAVKVRREMELWGA